MKTLTRLLLLALALLAAYMARRALRRQADAVTLLWALISLTATASTPNTAKARAVEDRVNTVVAAVGTAHGLAVSAGTAASTAQGSANTAQNLANNAQGTANTANAMANNANTNAGNRVAKTGDTMSGPLTVNDQVNCNTLNVNGNSTDNGHTSHGDCNADGTMHADQFTGRQVNATSQLFVSGQRIAPGQGRPAFYPQGGAPANSVIATDLNQIVGGLIAAGIFS